MTEAAHRRLFIGDVHGHYKGLLSLLEAIAPSSNDQIYFLGDLIDRGPASCQVVELVKASGYQCLLGNHEQLMLNAFPTNGNAHQAGLFSWFYCGGRDTMASYRDQASSLMLEHVAWMRTLPLYLDLGDVWLVHAGVHPAMLIQDQTSDQFCWIRNEFHRSPEPYFADKLIITGHTITFTLPEVKPGQLAQGSGWLDIDTGAYHPKSGWMTALDWTEQQVYQVNVYDRQVRVRPFSEAVTPVNPSKIKA
ncbi:MAG: serine/threonine protein phosphatase [Aphanocapsa sp. GSE-SYN-MK-11-07L]|jgi:serine/threonine protein phosphatase 1|nr:serine/threonine protein phosphatase [Aphanocapsa sp. GSE-SYN-MK-11-07L]